MDSYLGALLQDDIEEVKDMIDDFVSWCRKNDYPIDGSSFEMYFNAP